MNHIAAILLTTASVFNTTATTSPASIRVNIQHGGAARFADVYIPAGVRQPAPLVVVLHGGGSFPAMVAWESGFNAIADRYKFVVAYPAGTRIDGKPGEADLVWNDGRLFRDGRASVIDDVGFVLAVPAAVAKSAKIAIDQSRIYLAGYSNGAQLGYRIIKQQPPVTYKAFGAVDGHRGPNDLWPPPSLPTPIIQFSGSLDRLSPVMGGEVPAEFAGVMQTTLRPAMDAMRDWSMFNRCDSLLFHYRGKSMRMQYSKRRVPYVVWWLSEDAGHTWPGGRVAPSVAEKLGPVNRDMLAAEEMWLFFQSQR